MTEQKVKGKIVFSCDACPETVEPEDQDSWGDALAEARAAGWTVDKDGETWNHYCAACSEEKDDE